MYSQTLRPWRQLFFWRFDLAVCARKAAFQRFHMYSCLDLSDGWCKCGDLWWCRCVLSMRTWFNKDPGRGPGLAKIQAENSHSNCEIINSNTDYGLDLSDAWQIRRDLWWCRCVSSMRTSDTKDTPRSEQVALRSPVKYPCFPSVKELHRNIEIVHAFLPRILATANANARIFGDGAGVLSMRTWFNKKYPRHGPGLAKIQAKNSHSNWRMN